MNTKTPSRALVLKARIVERKELISTAIKAGRSAESIRFLQENQAKDEKEYRQLIENQ